MERLGKDLQSKEPAMKTSHIYGAQLIAALAMGLTLTGCSDHKSAEAPAERTNYNAQARTDNNRSSSDTHYTAQASPDRPVSKSMAADESISEKALMGKWTLNVSKTNNLNAAKGPGAIASDLTKDVMGRSWEFGPSGWMKIDTGAGLKEASFSVASNLLSVKDPREISYELSFSGGSLVTREIATGQYRVFDRAN
jgi:hypothetical protein